MWTLDEVCAAAAEALRSTASALDAEHSPYGLDASIEVGLHPVLAAGLARAGWNVLKESRYPSAAGRTSRAEGERCDIVLTPTPGETLRDPLLAWSLFADRGADPSEALWLEVKTAHQFAVIDGAARPNAQYGAEMLTLATADVRKLAADPGILHAALLLVMFTADEATAEHDLTAWAHRCLDRGLPISAPIARGFPIADRIGNGWCHAALTRVNRP